LNPTTTIMETHIAHQSLWRRIGGGSLTTAIVFHILLLIIGAIWVYRITLPVETKSEFIPAPGGGRGDASEVKATTSRKVRPSTNVARIAVNLPGDVTITPELGDNLSLMEKMSSISGSLGSGLGNGDGRGKGPGGVGDGIFPSSGINDNKLFLNLTPSLGKRCSAEDRLQRIRETGGTPECEVAVVSALRWLKANQSPDGSWGSTNKVAMTGLALLAYFGHCESPNSVEFGESCYRAIVYLTDIGMRNDGRLATNYTAKHWSYEHAIATYALGEAATFCKELKIDVPYLMEVTEKAGQFIIDNQNSNGGWAYLYSVSGGHTDVSVTGWQIQALKACSHTGIKYNNLSACINRSLKYLESCRDESGSYGYTGKNPAGSLSYRSLSGVGMLCNQMWGKGSNSDIRKSAKYILANTKLDYNSGRCDLYAHYYESQAMIRADKETWNAYNQIFRDQILQNQDTDGSWKVPGGGQKIEAVAPTWAASSMEGKIYRTCLCTLMLEVYYRFLNTDEGPSRRNRSI
jgi:hypothetical protein